MNIFFKNLLLFVIAVNCFAQRIDVRLTPIADTYINELNRSKNYGKLDHLSLTSLDRNRILIKFDHNEIDSIRKKNIEKAVLKIKVKRNWRNWKSGSYASIFTMNSAWEESDASWNCSSKIVENRKSTNCMYWSMRDHNGHGHPWYAEMVANYYLDNSTDDFIEFNLTNVLNNKNTSIKDGLILKLDSKSKGMIELYSRESRYPPELKVTYSSNGNIPPVAKINLREDFAFFKNTIHIDASESFDDKKIVKYEFSFSDGSVVVSDKPLISRILNRVTDSEKVVLKVIDEEGLSSIAELRFPVVRAVGHFGAIKGSIDINHSRIERLENNSILVESDICKLHPVKNKNKCLNLSDNDLSISIFYPDFTTEINDFELSRNEENKIVLKKELTEYQDENSQYSVVVGMVSSEDKKRLAIASKIDYKISNLKKRLNQLRASNSKSQVISFMNRYIHKLQDVTRKVKSNVLSKEGIYSEISQGVSRSASHSSGFYKRVYDNGYMFEIVNDNSFLKRGIKNKISVKVSNLKGKTNSKNLTLEVLENESLNSTFDISSMEKGEFKEFDFESLGDHDDFTSFDIKLNSNGRVISEAYFSQFIIMDMTPPLVEKISDRYIFKEVVSIVFRAKDFESGVDPSSAYLMIKEDKVFPSEIINYDDYTDFIFVSESLGSGDYSSEFYIKDNSGNSAEVSSYPFVVDNDAPIILADDPSDVNYSNNEYPLDLEIVDRFSVDTTVYLNDQIVWQGGNKNIDLILNLTLGANHVKVLSTDILGNFSELSFRLEGYDYIAPKLSLMSTLPALVQSNSFQMNFSVVEDSNYTIFYSVNSLVNKIEATNSQSFSLPLYLNEGINNIVFYIEDEYGNKTDNLLFTIERDSVAPVISTNQLPSFSNIDSYVISIDVKDNNFDFYEIIYEGKTIKGSSKSDQVSLLDLKNDKVDITIVAYDKAGNSSSISSYIIVDMEAPVLSISQKLDITNEVSFKLDYSVEELYFSRFEVWKSDILLQTITDSSQVDVILSLDEGENLFSFVVFDQAGNSSGFKEFSIKLDTVSPSVLSSSIIDGLEVEGKEVTLDFVFSEHISKLVVNNLEMLVNDSAYTYSFSSENFGEKNIDLLIYDSAGNSTSLNYKIIFKDNVAKDAIKPKVSLSSPLVIIGEKVYLNIIDPDDTKFKYKYFLNNKVVSEDNDLRIGFDTAGDYNVVVRAYDQFNNFGEEIIQIIVKNKPEQPLSMIELLETLPIVTKEELENMSFSDRYLYITKGDNAIQLDFDSGTVLKENLTLVKGKVYDQDGNPLSGVRVSCVDTPELGYTFTRDDGSYDFLITSSKMLTLEFTRVGYYGSQRNKIFVPNHVDIFDDVNLVKYSPIVTNVKFSDSQVDQFATSELTDDSRGKREIAMVFQPSTVATMVLKDGTEKTIESAQIRMTEYTVGENGQNRMPGTLPNTTEYTYAFEASVDEVIKEDALGVYFDRPVFTYVTNFLNLDPGSEIPNGYYSRTLKKWIPEPDGMVVEIVDIVDGKAVISVDPDRVPLDDEYVDILGFSSEELSMLATRYSIGDSFWRVGLMHFSPFDLNFTIWVPDNPLSVKKDNTQLANTTVLKNTQKACGSVIDVENQVLKEFIPLDDSNISMSYNSSYSSESSYNISVNITPEPSIKSVTFNIAGRSIEGNYKEQAEDKSFVYAVNWDGKDADGREVFHSNVPVEVVVKYTRNGRYPVCMNRSIYNRLRDWANLENSELTIGIPGVNARPDRVATSDGSSRGRITVTPRYKSFGGSSEEVIDSCRKNSENTLKFYEFEMPATMKYIKYVNSPLNATFVKGIKNWSFSNLHKLQDGKILMGDGSKVNGKAYVSRNLNTLYGYTGLPTTVFDYNSKGELVVRDSSNRNFINIKTGEKFLSENWTNDIDIMSINASDALLFYDRIDKKVYRAYQSGMEPDVLFTNVEYDANKCAATLEKMYEDGHYETIWNSDHGCSFDPYSYAIDSYNRLVYRAEVNGYHYLASIQGSMLKVLLVQNAGVSFGALHPEYEAKNGGRFLGRNNAYNITVDHNNHVYFSDGKTLFRVKNLREIDTFFGANDNNKFYENLDHFYGRDVSAYFTTHDFSVFNDIGVIHSYGTMFLYDFKTDVVSMLTKPGNSGVMVDGGNIKLTQNVGTGSKPKIFVNGDKVKISLLHSNGSDFYEILEGVGAPFVDTPKYVSKDILDNHVTSSIANESLNELYVFDSKTGFHLATYSLSHKFLKYRFLYNSSNELSTINDGVGNTLSLLRGNSGNVELIKSNDRNLVHLGYNSDNDLISTTQGEDLWLFSYDENKLMKSFSDPIGKESTFTYSNNRLVSDVNNQGNAVFINRNIIGTDFVKYTKTTALGRTDFIEHIINDDSGSQSRVVKSSGSSKSENFIPNVLKEVSYGNGLYERIEYKSSPLTNSKTSYVSKVQISLPSGKESLVTVDKKIVEGNGILDDYVTTIVDNGNKWENRYSYNELESILLSPEGRISSSKYYESGLISEVHSGGISTQFSYNDKGLPSVIISNNVYTEFLYDNNDRVEKISTNGINQYYEYDQRGRVVKSYGDDGRGRVMSYDGNGNLISINAIGGEIHQFTNNYVGQVSSYSAPLLSNQEYSTIYEYSLDKELTKIIYPSGDVNSFVYNDVTGLLNIVELSNETISLAYNTEGQLDSVLSSTGNSLTFTYDGRNIASISSDGDVVGNVIYDQRADGIIDGINLNNSRLVDYGYDKDKLLTQVGLPNNTLVDYSVDELGLLRSISYGDFIEVLEYDTNYRLKSSIVSYSGNEISKVELNYNNLNQVITKNVNGYTNSYSYDFSNQVVSDGEKTYSWDFNGNPLSAVVDAQDRLLTYKGLNFEYDYNGNVSKITNSVNGEIKEFESDESAILRSAKVGSNSIEYIIDPTGRRIGKRLNNDFFEGFLYLDRLNPVAKVDAAGNILETYIYGEKSHVPAFITKGGKLYRVISDNLGSVLKVVDIATGTVAQNLTYNTFGEITSDSNPGFQPFAYAGGLYDIHTGLTRFGARDYNPVTGRWMQKDPIGFGGGDTNLYRYVNNDPVNFIDPKGENPLAIAGALVGAGINVYQALQSKNVTPQQVILSGIVGGVTGAAAGFGGFGLAALAGFANNSSNQIIFTGDVDFGKAAIAGGITGLAGGAGQLTAKALGKVFFPVVSESAGFTAGALLGLAADTGISDNKIGVANACSLGQ